MPIENENLRERFGQFRILVIGRANAGKTTILKKICDSTEDPEIYDAEGKQVWFILVLISPCTDGFRSG